MEPIIDKNTKILILGTYPGIEALKLKEYYSDKRNKFWSLLGIDENLSYEEKIINLKKLKIGLWDVFKNAERKNSSLDKNIEDAELNNFEELKDKCPNLKIICLNGKTIFKKVRKIKKINIKEKIKKEANLDVVMLYSSSGVNARYVLERKEEWRKFFLEINSLKIENCLEIRN